MTAHLTPSLALGPIHNELDVLGGLLPLAGLKIIEIGCGAARMARELLQRPDMQAAGTSVLALDVDAQQHAKNLASPIQPGLSFGMAGAQHLPSPDAQFDLAWMLKSLHHVPLPDLAEALNEVARVLRPGAHLYVSEPVYAGPLNDIVRLYNDEGVVRAAAQRALDAALQTGCWSQVAERHFDMPVSWPDFAQFEQRMMQPTYAHYPLSAAQRQAVQQAFEQHMGPGGVALTRPMHVRLLRKH